MANATSWAMLGDLHHHARQLDRLKCLDISNMTPEQVHQKAIRLMSTPRRFVGWGTFKNDKIRVFRPKQLEKIR